MTESYYMASHQLKLSDLLTDISCYATYMVVFRKPLEANQWWELYDLKTKRYYYFNSTTQKTVWKKPNDGDIIPLAKLQMLKHKEFSRRSSLGSNSSNHDSKNEVIYSNIDLSSQLTKDSNLVQNIVNTNYVPFGNEQTTSTEMLSNQTTTTEISSKHSNSISSNIPSASPVEKLKTSTETYDVSLTSQPLYDNSSNVLLASSSLGTEKERSSSQSSTIDKDNSFSQLSGSSTSINTNKSSQNKNKYVYENVKIPIEKPVTQELIYDVPKPDKNLTDKSFDVDKFSDEINNEIKNNQSTVEYVNTSYLLSSSDQQTSPEGELNTGKPDFLSKSNDETQSHLYQYYDVVPSKASTLPRGKVSKLSEKPRFGSLRIQAPPKPPRSISANKENFLNSSHSISFDVSIQKSPSNERKVIERPKREPPQAPSQSNDASNISKSPQPTRNVLENISVSPVPTRRPDITMETKHLYENESPDRRLSRDSNGPVEESSPRETSALSQLTNPEEMIQEDLETDIQTNIDGYVTPISTFSAQKRITPGRQGDGVLSIYDNLTHSIYDNLSSEYSEDQTSPFSTMSTSPSKSFDMSASSSEVLTPTGSSLLRSDNNENRTSSFYERLKDADIPVDELSKHASPTSSPQPASMSFSEAQRTPPKRTPLTRMKSDSSDIEKRPKFSKPDQTSGSSFRPVSMLNLSVKPRRSRGSESDIPDQVELSKHRRGLLRKRISIHCMLSWSKTPIRKPMVLTRDKHLRREAVDVFKLILQYMGDKSTRKSQDSLSVEITAKGWSNASLRDEIYIQLCKQTTSNEKPSSLMKGWELITACLSFFPPSNKFHSYLEGYISRHLDDSHDNEVPEDVQTYAKHCYKQLERICQVGAKRGLKGPSSEEIQAAIKRAFNPSMFGNTLEDIMQMQIERFPDYRLPWILTCLTEAVLLQNGLQTEGIFRVPGDIDEVNALKLSMDNWIPPTELNDPHVPASLLKLWFRDLYEPLIPQRFYDQCIHNCDNEDVCLNIVNSLPDLNNLVFCYLIRLLQAFMIDENVVYSKMDANNLAMVWAPNCLRCPSDDPLEIFENTRKEMTFLRTVMQCLDTTFLEGVL